MISRGSLWHRWEPHIHAPGTVLNDQFKGPNAWKDYLTALEAAKPTLKAIAVTDYYITDTYIEVLRRHRDEGRLQNVELIMPNIELRLDVAAKSGFVNVHLLVSPEDPDHIDEIDRLLNRLSFKAFNDSFNCTRSDLIRLGKKSDTRITDDQAALKQGANQFKVNFEQLRQVWQDSSWAKENVMIAVAGGSTDGTSGVRGAADQVIRQEIEKFAHIIFASSDAQRDFWLGRKALNESEIRDRYKYLKPCLHGSDAHKSEDVAAPFGDRFSWIKGEVTFDALRQACIDPAGRTHIGAEPPKAATPSQVVANVSIKDATWAQSPNIPLNPGLVAIIGARGSGKTALADMIAAGCDALDQIHWGNQSGVNASFLARAQSVIAQEKIELEWGNRETVIRHLNGQDSVGPTHFPRARYLSQQFVEKLCSASGITDELLHEIERVIFEAHPAESREGAIDFEQLRDNRTLMHRQARQREAFAISQISEQIGIEHEKDQLKPTFEAKVQHKTNLIKGYVDDRTKLVSKGSQERVVRHSAVSAAAEEKRSRNRSLVNQRQAFLMLQAEVEAMRKTGAPETLRQAQARHTSTGLAPNQWQAFLLDYKGPVDTDLNGYIRWVEQEIATLRGSPTTAQDPNTPYFPEGTDLATVPLLMLEAELTRIEKLISADHDVQRRYADLTRLITAETAELEELKKQLENANGASARIRALDAERNAAYLRVFEALIAEQSALEELYQPLMKRLTSSSGTLGKLSFSVSRVADIDHWSMEAENDLLDLRKGPLRGQGSLSEKVQGELSKAWVEGTAADVGTAMANFRQKYQHILLQHSPVQSNDPLEMRAWLKRFAQWLFSVDHLGVQYGISYDGIDIEKLSPGTRGIVLLLLYLALDETDNRPLIIDQPEENLDPKSVFDELVELFLVAKTRRQVIMVTHNANLVINTDADQVIVAESGPHPTTGLPPLTYMAGGLENATIRTAVCNIVEGGEQAFRERARRLRVHLDR